MRNVECQTEFSVFEPGQGIEIITKFEEQIQAVDKMMVDLKGYLHDAIEACE